ncbi:MAG: hypothetical protein JEY94_14830 [Melioribacteraceae bacterium]|nr:hypothetical protein [Melioribacteraceae bacterium]
MNTGQTMLTVAAMMLLSAIVLRINNNFLNTNTVMMENRFGVLALSLATSYIEEATGKAFDAQTDEKPVETLGELTSPGGLGPGSGEVYPFFNDFDDFNGLTRLDTSMRSAYYNVECHVDYINPANPDVAVNSTTWHKKITVNVFSTGFMRDTVSLSSIYSYFYFR